LKTSRKILAAIGTGGVRGGAARARLKSTIVKAPKIATPVRV
jgi:hypothetical protein